MSIKVNYKGAEILSYGENGTKTLKTSGYYCEDDIQIVNTQDGGITPTGTIEITENGTYDVTEKASAVVNVSGGGANPYFADWEYTETVITMTSDITSISQADAIFKNLCGTRALKLILFFNNKPFEQISQNYGAVVLVYRGMADRDYGILVDVGSRTGTTVIQWNNAGCTISAGETFCKVVKPIV